MRSASKFANKYRGALIIELRGAPDRLSTPLHANILPFDATQGYGVQFRERL
jgi:hypothetical protein